MTNLDEFETFFKKFGIKYTREHDPKGSMYDTYEHEITGYMEGKFCYYELVTTGGISNGAGTHYYFDAEGKFLDYGSFS